MARIGVLALARPTFDVHPVGRVGVPNLEGALRRNYKGF
jgi:hypothetical protein